MEELEEHRQVDAGDFSHDSALYAQAARRDAAASRREIGEEHERRIGRKLPDLLLDRIPEPLGGIAAVAHRGDVRLRPQDRGHGPHQLFTQNAVRHQKRDRTGLIHGIPRRYSVSSRTSGFDKSFMRILSIRRSFRALAGW